MAISRLTLTFTAASSSVELASVGAALAARLGVGIQGMVFLERNLLRLAELRQLPRIRMPSGESEAVGPAELAMELHLQGERLRAAVGAAAQKAGIAWSFESVVDEAAEIDPTATGAIVLATTNGLLGHRRDLVRRLFRQVHGLMLLPASTAMIRRPAVLIRERDAGQFIDDAVEFARRIRADRPIDVLLSDAVDAGVIDRLERWPTPLRIRRLPPSGDLEALGAQLPAKVDSLIIATAALPEHESPIGRLLEASHRPVLLLRRDET